ncbi:MAG: YbjQ family protein [Bacillota bacterium]|nr:YbjQ family protein [Bacillota bacterium]MDD3298165.1 YbjQ family protein [Bacillota bacterium]MDD3850355.1 YbjQ family protein [Bacillota bacterium]MDD4707947.1 YbjQ family protein [Bacillota bacterium]
MILVNTNDVPGKTITKVYGLVKGNTIHSKHIGKDIMAGFRTLVGGEIKEYTEMLSEARKIALKRMVEEAEALGANAVVNVRFSTSSVMQGAAELLAYGTAVWVK